jgi:hypothetical protein
MLGVWDSRPRSDLWVSIDAQALQINTGGVPANFKKRDLTCALKAARAGGLDVDRVEIDPVEGKIILFAKSQTSAPVTLLEKWKLERARSS